MSRCGNGGRLISDLVYPFAGSSPATGTNGSMAKLAVRDDLKSHWFLTVWVRCPLELQIKSYF